METYDFLIPINANADPVLDDSIMSRLSSAQIATLRSEEEVPPAFQGHSTIDNRAQLMVVVVHASVLGLIEAGVVAVDDVGDLWLRSVLALIHGLTCALDETKLFPWGYCVVC